MPGTIDLSTSLGLVIGLWPEIIVSATAASRSETAPCSAAGSVSKA